jgi:hypothetical protein
MFAVTTYDSCKDDRWCHTLIHAVHTHIHIPRPKRGQTVVCESGHACERSTYTPWGRTPATVCGPVLWAPRVCVGWVATRTLFAPRWAVPFVHADYDFII